MKQEQVKEHFSEQADKYEKLMVKLVPHYREQHQIIFDLLPEDDKEYHVLDLACGNGVLSELVFRKLPNSYVVGFDLTENMLTAFEKKLSSHTGKFNLVQGDYRTDSIGKGYDIILASLTLHHLTWEQRKRFYLKLYSALNSNGLFITRDIIIDENQTIAQEQYSYWKRFMQSKGFLSTHTQGILHGKSESGKNDRRH